MNESVFNTVVFEPSPLLCEGICGMIHQIDFSAKNFRTTNIEAFSNTIKQNEIHLVFVNPMMIQNRLQFWKKIKRIHPQIKWVAFASHFFESEVIDFFDHVFSLYTPMNEIKGKLIKLTHDAQENAQSQDSEILSEREAEVLTLLIRGLSNKEIADKLNLSVHTVISHRKNIVLKTGIKSQSGLTIYAISNNIVSLDEFS